VQYQNEERQPSLHFSLFLGGNSVVRKSENTGQKKDGTRRT